jgi:hypothetical protein
MLPLLLFEVAWKAIWLLVVALPLWTSHQMDPDTAETAVECLMGAVFLVLIPWPYVVSTYLSQPGDRWFPARAARPLGAPSTRATPG